MAFRAAEMAFLRGGNGFRATDLAFLHGGDGFREADGAFPCGENAFRAAERAPSVGEWHFGWPITVYSVEAAGLAGRDARALWGIGGQ